MDIKILRKGVYERTKPNRKSVFDRLGGRRQQNYIKNDQVCNYWLAGRCNRNPCRFLHSHSSIPQQSHQSKPSHQFKSTWRNPSLSSTSNTNVRTVSSASKEISTTEVGGSSSQKAQQKLCQNWATDGNCVDGDKCKDLHSWFSGSGFFLLTKLESWHNKAITGISLPSGCDKLFSGSKDEHVCVWDCHSGQCVSNVKPGIGEIGCLISEGPWVFVGLENAVRAWNIKTQAELTLVSGQPVGLVKAMVVGGDDDDILFGGVQNGSIVAWKFNCSPEPVAMLKGHRLAVLSLIVGTNHRLYSGAKDDTIRVWDIKTLRCLQTLNGHTNFVSSLICWDKYLLSGSLDGTLKVWATTDESGGLGVVYEVKEKSGILDLGGIEDAQGKHILLCSCKDNTVRLYELPSFAERGRIFAKSEIHTVERGCGGLFFTGDATGELSVWKLLGEPTEKAGSS